MKVYLLNNFHKFHIYPSSKCFQHNQPLVCIYPENTREYFQAYQYLLLNLIILFLCSFANKYLLLEVSLSSVPLFSSSEALFTSSGFYTFFDETFKGFIFKIYCELLSFRPGVDGGRVGGQNFGQILNVILRNLRPYRLSMGNPLVYL